MKRGFLNDDKGKKSVARHVSSAPPLVSRPEPLNLLLPIGKVDTTLPEGYDSNQNVLSFTGRDAFTSSYSDDTIVHTTLPPKLVDGTRTEYPDSWTECLFIGGRAKRAILDTPGFPSPIPRPSPERYRIGPSPHGIGMFATRDLKLNDLIIAERPLLVVPKFVPLLCQNLSADSTVTHEQMTQVHLFEYEKLLKVCVDRMEPEDRTAFLALHNCHTEDGSGPIFGILRTNAIGVTIGTAKEYHDSLRLQATFNVISRVNHSCVLNACYHFDISSFSCQLRAARDIKKGEEILIGYCPISMPTAGRQEALKPYFFECTCPACSNPASDALLMSIQQSTAYLQDFKSYEEFVTKDPAINQTRLQHSLEWMAKMEAAGWQTLPEYGEHLEAVIGVMIGLGRRAEFMKYGAILEAWREAVNVV